MSQVAIVVDSTASIPADLVRSLGIEVVPYHVHVGHEDLRDGVTVDTDEIATYLERLDRADQMPKTANPSPGDYARAFVQAAQRAGAVVSIHMTSVGSGAFQAALLAQQMVSERLRDVRIEIVDTRNVSMAHGWIALQAARASEAGASLRQVLDLVGRMIPVTRMIQTADTLRYLYLGGRIGRAKHLVGSLLRIKPLIGMEDGVITALGVARSRANALKRMASMVAQAAGPEGGVRLALTHVAALPEARQLHDLVARSTRITEVLYCKLSPALAVHSGPGTVGLCYTLDKD